MSSTSFPCTTATIIFRPLISPTRRLQWAQRACCWTVSRALPNRTTLERREDFAPAHLHLAYQHLRERRIDEAVPHLERAAALAPEGVEARRVLGKVLERQGNFEAAIDHYRRALEIAPDPEGHVLLANALRVTGDDEAAFEHYRLAEQLRRGPP